MTRDEAIKRAAELKVVLIQLHTPTANTSIETWEKFFEVYPMRSRKNAELGLLGFIEMAESKINHYKSVLGVR